jgi:hypothetical protein
MRVYWQQFVDALDLALDNIISAQADIIDTQNDIIAILVRLGLVEVLADGTFDIVDQGLNADGTVKPNKVLTESAVAEAFADPLPEVGTTTTIPSSGVDTVLHTSSVQTVGDATFGSYTVFIQGTWDNSTNHDAGADIFLEIKENGGSWVRQTDYTQRCGSQTTGGGDTTTYIPLANMYSNAGVGITTVQVRLVGAAFNLGGAGLKASTVTKPRSVIIPAKR